MSDSAARLAANRANARRSTGPRTPEGKARSSLNAVSHGVYASDDTVLAHAATQGSGEGRDSSAGAPTGAAPPGDHLAAFTAQFQPEGPVELLLVRRLAALAARLELLSFALDQLLEIDERRAFAEHLLERFKVRASDTRYLLDPPWADQLRAYDGLTRDDGMPLSVDPDLDAGSCALAYTLSSPRAALLMRHEAAVERRFQQLLNDLIALQSIRERRSRIAPEPTSEQLASPSALLPRVTHRGPAQSAAAQPAATTASICRNEPISRPPAQPATYAIFGNEPNPIQLPPSASAIPPTPPLLPMASCRWMEVPPHRKWTGQPGLDAISTSGRLPLMVLLTPEWAPAWWMGERHRTRRSHTIH